MKKSFFSSLTKLGIAIILTFIMTGKGFAQQQNRLETDKGIAASIATYDADTRNAILEASLYPQVLQQIEKRQNQAQSDFQNVIAQFNQDKQNWFYTLTRFPDLMHRLATSPTKIKKRDFSGVLPNQDPDLHEAAWRLYRFHHADLVTVDNIGISAQQDFDNIIANLSPNAKSAFQKLSNMPDIMSLLTSNIDLTTKLGAQYQADAVGLNNSLSALHDSLTVQNQIEAAAMKKQIDSDPQAQQELNDAARAYGQANGYNMPSQQNNYYGNNIYAYPYSYWYGYPYWYATPMWYPGAFWNNFGFGFGLGGFGWNGYFSYGFGNWFFNSGYYRYYPHLYRQCGNYYNSHMNNYRYTGSANRGFMSVANNHFTANGGGRTGMLNSAGGYSRPSGGFGQSNQGGFNGNATRNNSSFYHASGWGQMGGNAAVRTGGSTFSTGGFSRGSGGFGGGFSGGGSRGGGFSGGGFGGGSRGGGRR